MTLAQLADVAQIVAALGVIGSLVFVALQVRQNTAVLVRGEHNSTMAQWTVIRMAIVESREIAEFMTAGLNGERALDATDRLRLNHFLNENAWAAFHIWDRTQRGVFPKGTFEATGGLYLRDVLTTPGGREWWQRARSAGFLPGFVADVDAMLAGE